MPSANPVVKATLVVVLAAGLIVGCQTTTDPYTGEKKTTSTTLGALIGAGVGALAGGAVGNYMDRQESELRALMRDSGVTVTRKGEDIVLNMPGNITFRTGSADLNAQFFKVLPGLPQAATPPATTNAQTPRHPDHAGRADFN